jgi:lipopolysaccharide/colanic/teichoic acid biosynthesis glycosyltransferase
MTAGRSSYIIVKTVAEWLLAFVLFVASFPVFLILAILVKVTSNGPAIYSQTRLGRYGRTYRIFKLRSMVQNAEAGTGAVWASKTDARITTIGKILRATHLDEIPQLWNVLRGEMALIGPRPERPELASKIEKALPDFPLRLAVRPGITGLAQMLLPADDPDDAEYKCVRKKLAQDIHYVRNAGFVMDLRVALATPCYFIAAAIQAVREILVNSYSVESEVVVKTPAVKASRPIRNGGVNRDRRDDWRAIGLDVALLARGSASRTAERSPVREDL